MIISVSLGGLRPRLLAAPEPFMQPVDAARGAAFLAPEGASGAGIILAGRYALGRGAEDTSQRSWRARKHVSASV